MPLGFFALFFSRQYNRGIIRQLGTPTYYILLTYIPENTGAQSIAIVAHLLTLQVHTIPTWLKICIAENGITTPVATLFSLLYTVIHSNSHFSFFLWLCVTFGFYPNLSSFYRPHPFSYSCPAAEEIAATFVRIYFFLEQERRALFI